MPIFAQMNCTTHIIGNVNSAVHNIEKPSAAPACAYVPMPDGSSSEAPVISPGPRSRKNRLSGFFSLARRVANDSIGSLMGSRSPKGVRDHARWPSADRFAHGHGCHSELRCDRELAATDDLIAKR